MKAIFSSARFDRTGGPLSLLAWARFLRELGVEVVFFTEGGDLVGEARAAGFETSLCPAGRRRPAPAAVADLVALARRTGAEVLIASGVVPALEAALAAHLLGRAAVPCLNINAERLGPYSTDWRFPSLPPMVCVSEHLAELWTERYGYPPGTFRPVPARYDLEEIRGRAEPAPLSFKLPKGPFVVLLRRSGPARLGGVLAALDLFEKLAERVAGLGLVVIGGGEEIAQTRARAAEINRRLRREAVILAGEREDAPAFLARAELVFSSERGVVETLALGRPAIVVGEEGAVDLVEEKNIEGFWRDNFMGQAVPAAAGGPLPDRLERLLRDPEAARRLGSMGRLFVEERADARRGARELKGIFEEALQTASSRSGRAARLALSLGGCLTYSSINLRRAVDRRINRLLAHALDAKNLRVAKSR